MESGSKLTLRSLMVLGEVKQRVNSCSKIKYSRFGTSLASRKYTNTVSVGSSKAEVLYTSMQWRGFDMLQVLI